MANSSINTSADGPKPLSRRTLLGIVTGVVALGSTAGLITLQTADAARLLRSKPRTPRRKIQTAPAYPAPGQLAQSRLQPEIVALMTGATRFSARRRRELSTDVAPGVARESPAVSSTRFPFTMPGMGTPKPDQAQMARRFADLLLRDEVWAGGGLSDAPFHPDFVFTFADTFPGIVVSVCPHAHAIRLDWVNETRHAARTNILALDPIGNEMAAFIKETFPGDAAAQSLTFVPRVAPSLPIPTRPAQVPPATWEKINALKPGMTRAEVLQLFETEGGLSNRLHRSYRLKNIRGEGTESGKYLKINVEFAPADSPLLWRSGKGFFQNPQDVPSAARGAELSTDVILSLSSLYWGYLVID